MNLEQALDRIQFLEKRHETLVRWMRRQIVETKKQLDFTEVVCEPLEHYEDFVSRREAKDIANDRLFGDIATFEYMLEALKNYDEAEEKKRHPTNEYSI
jgi:hypothetical protein